MAITYFWNSEKDPLWLYFENRGQQYTPADRLEISFIGDYGQIVELEVAFSGDYPY